jgi:hypothetical protein
MPGLASIVDTDRHATAATTTTPLVPLFISLISLVRVSIFPSPIGSPERIVFGIADPLNEGVRSTDKCVATDQAHLAAQQIRLRELQPAHLQGFGATR